MSGDNKPIIKAPASLPSGTHTADPQTQAEMTDINLPPAKHLALLHKRIEIRYERMLNERENDHHDLRELSRLRKDRFDSIWNSVLSAFLVALGSYILGSKKIPFHAAPPLEAVECIGWIIIGLGVIWGIAKPPLEALLWKCMGHKDPLLKCLNCGSPLVKKRKD